MKNILRYFFRYHKKFIIFYSSLKALSLAAHINSLFFLIDYINILLGKGSRLKSLSIFYNNYPNLFFYSFPLLTALIIFMGYFMSYKARCLSVEMMINSEKNIFKDYIYKISSTNYLPDNGIFTKNSIIRLFNSDIRYFCRLNATLMDVTIPVIIIAVIFIKLIYDQPLTTMIVVVITTFYSIIFIKYSRFITKITNKSSDLSIINSRYRRKILDLSLTNQMSDKNFQSNFDNMFLAEDITSFLHNYGLRLKTNDTLLLYLGFFMALVLSSLVFHMGREIISGKNVLQNSIVYIIGINYSLIQFRALTGSIAKIRFFQQSASRCLDFISKLNEICHKNKEKYLEPIEISKKSAIVGVNVPNLRVLNKQTMYTILKKLGKEYDLPFSSFISGVDDIARIKAEIIANSNQLDSKLTEIFEKELYLENFYKLKKLKYSMAAWSNIDTIYKFLFQIENKKYISTLLIDTNSISSLTNDNIQKLILLFNSMKCDVISVYFKNPKILYFNEKIIWNQSESTMSETSSDDDEEMTLTMLDN